MAADADLAEEPTMRAPIVEEKLHVEKRLVGTGVVTVTSAVFSEDVSVREELAATSIRVERVPIGRFVDAVPPARTEGDRTVLSVVEEVLVKRIRLVEEVHLIREHHVETVDETVTLRRLDVNVERTNLPAEAESGSGTLVNRKAHDG